MERLKVTGLPVDVLDLGGLLDGVSELIERGARSTVAYLNVHVANVAAKDQRLAKFLNGCDIVYCDGEGIRLGAKMLGHELPERMTGADWIWDLAARAEGEWRIFWIGGEPGVTHRAAEKLTERHPDLEIACDHGFYQGDRYKGVVKRINEFEPHIILVGMGTPLQEQWVERWRDELDAPVVWVLGATADFISGEVNRGPQWLYERQEWLARLITEPRRLASRYLIGNGRFLARVGRERISKDLGWGS